MATKIVCDICGYDIGCMTFNVPIWRKNTIYKDGTPVCSFKEFTPSVKNIDLCKRHQEDIANYIDLLLLEEYEMSSDGYDEN